MEQVLKHEIWLLLPKTVLTSFSPASYVHVPRLQHGCVGPHSIVSEVSITSGRGRRVEGLGRVQAPAA